MEGRNERTGKLRKHSKKKKKLMPAAAAPIQPERTLDPSPTTDRRRTDADGHDMTLQCRHPPRKEMEWLFRDCLLPELRDQSSQGRTGGRGHIINKVGLNVLGLSLNVRVR